MLPIPPVGLSKRNLETEETAQTDGIDGTGAAKGSDTQTLVPTTSTISCGSPSPNAGRWRMPRKSHRTRLEVGTSEQAGRKERVRSGLTEGRVAGDTCRSGMRLTLRRKKPGTWSDFSRGRVAQDHTGQEGWGANSGQVHDRSTSYKND